MKLLNKTVYVWTRDLHLCFGLFVSPFVLLFAVSTLMFNHTWRPGEAGETVRGPELPVEIPEGAEGIEQAKAVMRQLGVSGEIQNLFRRKERLTVPIMAPGRRATVRVDLARGVATVEAQETGFWDGLLYLHKSPGPHVAAIRGNWVFTRIWRWMADSVVCLVLFISASGIYMWIVLKAERRVGLVMAGAGCLSFFALVWAVVL